MVAAPPLRRRPAAVPAAPPTKLVCFRLGSWRVGMTVDEVRGMFVGMPLIPTSKQGYSFEVQIATGRVPVRDLRGELMPQKNTSQELATVALVETWDGLIGLAFDHADEVIPVNPRAWAHHELDAFPFPARARSITRHGDVFWLDLKQLTATLTE